MPTTTGCVTHPNRDLWNEFHALSKPAAIGRVPYAWGMKKQQTDSKVLSVRADPPEIGGEERKRRVTGLANAIAHELRHGKVYITSIGEDAIRKAVKAIVEASRFVVAQGHELNIRPGYIMAGDVAGKGEMKGMSFLVETHTSRGNPTPTVTTKRAGLP